MQDGFALLEERVEKAAARLRQLQDENRVLHSELASAKARAEKAEQAAGDRSPEAAARTESAAAALREVEGLRREREEIRLRVRKLVELLQKLE